MLKVGDRLLCKKKRIINYPDYKNFVIDDECAYFDYDWYSLNPNDDYWYLWEYFYTPKELRKLKLKQLNRC